jgi:hypothetical protein
MVKIPKHAGTVKDRLDRLLPALGRRIAPEGVIHLNSGVTVLESMRSHTLPKQRSNQHTKLRAE